MLNRRHFAQGSLLALGLACSGGLAAAAEPVTFHFYGAEDCPPCMAFKRDHLAHVQAEGQDRGFAVEDNVIRRTRDVPKEGVYGDRDAILRLAAPQLDYVYPPIFFVSKGGEIMSVHGHDWAAALKAAQEIAGQAS